MSAIRYKIRSCTAVLRQTSWSQVERTELWQVEELSILEARERKGTNALDIGQRRIAARYAMKSELTLGVFESEADILAIIGSLSRTGLISTVAAYGDTFYYYCVINLASLPSSMDTGGVCG